MDLLLESYSFLFSIILILIIFHSFSFFFPSLPFLLFSHLSLTILAKEIFVLVKEISFMTFYHEVHTHTRTHKKFPLLTTPFYLPEGKNWWTGRCSSRFGRFPKDYIGPLQAKIIYEFQAKIRGDLNLTEKRGFVTNIKPDRLFFIFFSFCNCYPLSSPPPLCKNILIFIHANI